MSELEDFQKENTKLKREIELLKQSLNQVKVIKKAYKESSHQIRQKDIQLQKQVQRTQAIFNAQTSLVITTTGQHIRGVNTQFFKLFDFKDLDDFTSQYNCICELFIDKKNKPHLMPQMDGLTWLEYIDHHPELVHEAYIEDKDGKERIFEVKSSGKIFDDVAADQNEEVAVFTDITELKHKDKQLYESQKNASLGKMIRNIAHQWRQPLAAVSASVNSIKLKSMLGKLDKEQVNELTDEILDGIEYISDMIDTFGNFVQTDYQTKIVIVQEEIKNAIKVFKTIINSDVAEVKLNILYDNPIEMEIISNQLQQVLINILTNSKDVLIDRRISNGWIELKMDVQDNNIIITIEDNGKGIPEENLSQVFDPYFTTKHQARETGLGLNMAHKIVTDSFYGNIYVYNTQNGAKFFIEIPLNNKKK